MEFVCTSPRESGTSNSRTSVAYRKGPRTVVDG
jgi:hypothetical protein